jgi:hypothetical protein
MHRMTKGIARLIVSVMAAAASVFASTAVQSPPNFSGQWVIEPVKMPLSTGGPPTRPDQGQLAQGDMGSGWGSPITITQDAAQLVVEQTLFNRYDAAAQPRFRYALDGSDTTNTAMIGHTTQVRRSRAAWEGQELRITTQYPGVDPGSGKAFTTDVTHRLRLESPNVLIIEVTRSAPLGGKPTTTRTVYRKN